MVYDTCAIDPETDPAGFIEYLLSEEAQKYLSEEAKEYPPASGVGPEGDLPSLSSFDSPDVDLGDLSGLRGTQVLLRDVGLFQ